MLRERLRTRAVNAGRRLIRHVRRLGSESKKRQETAPPVSYSESEKRHQEQPPQPPVQPSEDGEFQETPPPSSSSASFASTYWPMSSSEGLAPAPLSTPPSRLATPDAMTALYVTMTIRGESPVHFTFNKAYETDPSFEDTDQICNGFNAHMDHGVREIITRHDFEADEVLDEETGLLKTPRYHIFISTRRRGRNVSERHYRSYQREIACDEDIQDVAVELDRMVARYLGYHDRAFQWENPYYAGTMNPLRHLTAPPIVNSAQGLACVPSRFAEPGYGIEATLRVNEHGVTRDWMTEISSSQSAPLTLAMAEALMSDVSTATRHVVRQLEESFEATHARCTGREGSTGCNHYSEDAFELQVRIDNNLGPAYHHLSDRIACYRILLPSHDNDKFNSFVETLQAHLKRARDLTDHVMDNMEDLRIHVHELRAKDWVLRDPLMFIFDSSRCIDREAITKIVGRLRSGIRHELLGRGVSALVTAHKRGHLIFDTLFHGGQDLGDNGQPSLLEPSELDTFDIQTRLAKRIRRDLQMSLKNTINGRGKHPLASLTIYTPPMASERAMSSAQSSLDSNSARQIPSGQLPRVPKHDYLRLLYEDHGVHIEKGIRPSAMPALAMEEEHSGTDMAPSLVHTDSIGALDDGAMTPAGSHEKQRFWSADRSRGADSATSHQLRSDESAHASKSTHHQDDVHAIRETSDAPFSDERASVTIDVPADEDGILTAMAGIVAQNRRMLAKKPILVEERQNWSPPTTKLPIIRRILSAFYSQPHTNNSPSSGSDRASGMATPPSTDIETSADEDESQHGSDSEASVERGRRQKRSDEDTRPLLMRQVGSPRLTTSTSSLIVVTGHIARREQSPKTRGSSSS